MGALTQGPDGVYRDYSPAYAATRAAHTKQQAATETRKNWIKAGIIGTGALITGGALGAFGGVAGGTGTTVAGGGGAAAGAGAGASMTSPWWKVATLGASTFGNIYGANKASTSNRDALAAQMRAGDQAAAIALADRDESKRQFDLQQALLKADLDARNKFEADKWAASEEERLYDRRMKDAREARRAPYRTASLAALGQGWASPGMGSLGSFRST